MVDMDAARRAARQFETELRAHAPEIGAALDALDELRELAPCGCPTRIIADEGHQAGCADAAEIEAIGDDRRIFQALCTEHGRLGSLLGYDMGDNDRARKRAARLTATREHTARLRDRYAAKLAALPGTPDGCECVVLTSGNVHPCAVHVRGS